MKKQILLHITELLLALTFIVIKWPFYEGDEYISNFVYCGVYIILILFYCAISALVPAMKLACNINEGNSNTIKKIITSQTPWVIFAAIIAYAFQNSLGLWSCIPIVFPNCFFLSIIIMKESQKIKTSDCDSAKR